MKQVTQNMRDGKTSVIEVPTPTVRPGVALVKVANSLVSAGTERMLVEFGEKSLIGKARSRPDLVKQVLDKVKREGIVPTLEATFNRLDSPMPLGYSSSGIIVEVGEGMEPFKPGDRVACAGGGFAVHSEYNLVPKNLLTVLPDGVDLESAAFTTLGAIALHGFRLAENQLGDHVAVIGLGLLGLMTIQIAKAAGCSVFGIDPQEDRVALARSFGVTACPRDAAPELGLAFTKNQGFDSVIICADTSSNDPIELAGLLSRDRAKVVATGAIGLTMPRKVYYEKELSFINSRSYGPGRYDPTYEEKGQDYPIGYVRWTEGRNFSAIIDLINSGNLQVKPLITHRFEIPQAADAYEVITGKTKQKFLGVLLTYPSSEDPIVKRVSFTPQTTPQAGEVCLGVIGAGLYANATLLPALKKTANVTLAAISSSNGLNAAHSGKKFGFGYACTGDEEILNDPAINAVAILTRHDTHAALAARALQAGKHVFVEKPAAINKDQLGLLLEAAQSHSGQVFMVGFNRRFAPLIGQTRTFFSNRAEPMHIHYRVNAGFIPPNHWTQDPAVGGGRIIGEGCHFIDLVTSLIGRLPTSVSAWAMPNNGKYKTDNVSMTFTYPDGSLAVIDYLSNGDKSYQKEWMEVFCGGRIAVLNDYQSLELIHDGKRSTFKSSLGQDKGHRSEMEAFLLSIRNGKQAIQLEEIAAVTNASFAVLRSIAENGAPIRLDS